MFTFLTIDTQAITGNRLLPDWLEFYDRKGNAHFVPCLKECYSQHLTLLQNNPFPSNQPERKQIGQLLLKSSALFLFSEGFFKFFFITSLSKKYLEKLFQVFVDCEDVRKCAVSIYMQNSTPNCSIYKSVTVEFTIYWSAFSTLLLTVCVHKWKLNELRQCAELFQLQ